MRAREPRGEREHLTNGREVILGRKGGNPSQLGSMTWADVVLQALMLGLKGELSFRQKKSMFQAKGQGKHRHRQGRWGRQDVSSTSGGPRGSSCSLR